MNDKPTIPAPAAVDINKSDLELQNAAFNMIHWHAEQLNELLVKLATAPDKVANKRWLAIARTDLQKGFMSLRRVLFNNRADTL